MPLSLLYKTLSPMALIISLSTTSPWASMTENEEIPSDHATKSNPIPQQHLPKCPFERHTPPAFFVGYDADETYTNLDHFSTQQKIESFTTAMSDSISKAADKRATHIIWNDRLEKVLILLKKSTLSVAEEGQPLPSSAQKVIQKWKEALNESEEQTDQPSNPSTWAKMNMENWKPWSMTWKNPNAPLQSQQGSSTSLLSDASRKSSCDLSTKEIEENFTRVHREIVLDINKTLISLIAERPAQTAPLLKEEDLNPSYV